MSPATAHSPYQVSPSQNLPPVMPFIEPIEPIQLPADLISPSSQSADQNLFTSHQPSKGKGAEGDEAQNPVSGNAKYKSVQALEEEVLIGRARQELERQFEELKQLKNQLARTEQRERELASRIST